MAELAKASMLHPRDQGMNLSQDIAIIYCVKGFHNPESGHVIFST
jgi:hypothetical protein